MLGIIIGVSSVIAIVTIGNSAKNYIVSMINSIGGQSVQLYLDGDYSSGDRITEDDIDAIRKLDDVAYVSPQINNMGTALTGTDSTFAMIFGGNEDYAEFMNVNIVYGRFYNADEYDSSRHVCVLNEAAAKYFFGKSNAVGESLTVSVDDAQVTLKIIGISRIDSSVNENLMESMMSMFGISSDDVMARIYMPATLLQSITGGAENYDNIYFSSVNTENQMGTAETVRNLMYARHNNIDREVYSVEDMSTMVDLLNTVINIFTVFISAVGAISLIVGGIGVMNIMLVSVTERTREIGIRKALGAKTSTIMVQFLTESVIICLIGGLIGMAFGIGISYAVAAYMGVPVSLSFTTFLIAVGFSSLVGIFFGIYPAKKAAKMPPIEALRRE